jgi:hypothetical protein
VEVAPVVVLVDSLAVAVSVVDSPAVAVMGVEEVPVLAFHHPCVIAVPKRPQALLH